MRYVNDVLTNQDQARNRTPGQRRRATRDALRSRATYDLPKELIEKVSALAIKEAVPASQLVAILLIAGLEVYQDGKLVFEKEASRSPLFEWIIKLPEIS